MIAVRDVVDAVLGHLRDIPELVQIFGESGIYTQLDEEHARDLSDAINAMPTPGLMVVWDGLTPAQLGGITRFGHNVSAVLRLETPAEYHAALALIVDGVPEGGDGLPLLTTDFLDGALVMAGAPSFTRMLDGSGTELWQLTLPPLMEAGG
jgi:hypothetical protein